MLDARELCIAARNARKQLGLSIGEFNNLIFTAAASHKLHIRRAQCRTGAKMAAELLGKGYSASELAPFGFPSLQAFSDVVSDFVEVHLWTWQAIAKILVKRRGGIAWSHSPPKFLMFNLKPTPMLSRPRAERNPATTFTLDFCQFWDLNSFHACVPSAARQWEEWEESRRHVERSHCSNKLYAGLLPVQFKIDTVNIMTLCHYIPQFNPPFEPPPEQIGRAHV